MKGISGDTLMPTGTPAFARASMVLRRRAGEAARGSRMRASAGSSVVTETKAIARPSAAIGAMRSRSRSMPEDFVITENGCLNSLSTSMTDRVMRSRRSAGW